MYRWVFLTALLVGCGLAAAQEKGLTEQEIADLSEYFGFGEMQIYKIKPEISNLTLADLNVDGRTDVLLWNPRQSRFEIFYQPDPDAPAEPKERANLEPNEIPSRGPMRQENVPVAYRVASVAVGELTGDDRPDIVFFGDPKEIVILPGQVEGGFDAPRSIRAPEGEPRHTALALGDFNGDDRTDVVLLGKDLLEIYPQKAGGGLDKPARLVHGISSPGLMLAADINGDGRDDLAIGTDEDQYGVYVCLQNEAGSLSAFQRAKVPTLRSMTFSRAEHGADLFSIEQATGHLKHYRWDQTPTSGGTTDWPQRLYSYPFKIRSKRLPVALGDLTGDGLPDVVLSDSDSAQLILFRGAPAGLLPGVAYPGLIKTSDLLLADVDGDGALELLSASPNERTLGLSEYEDGRIAFPRPLSVRGEPLVIAAGPLKKDDEVARLICLVRQKDEDEEGGSGAEKIRFLVLDPAEDKELQRWEVEEVDDPGALRLADFDRDGRRDLILLDRFSEPQVFLQNESGEFKPFGGPATRESLIQGVRPGGFYWADVTGDGQSEALMAQQGLVRALIIEEGRWTVVDQYNAPTPDAEITGVAVLPGADGRPLVALYDRRARELVTMQQREDGTYEVAQTMPVGNFDLSAMSAVPGSKSGVSRLLLLDTQKLALLTPGEVAPTFVAQRSYETEVNDAWLMDAVPGDLNHDGIRDVAVVDGRKAAIEIVTSQPGHEFVRAARFQVFQGKRFSSEPDSYGEPREVLIADLTGDGHVDIAMIVHDRLIVYPAQ